ncbi:TRANSPORTER putative-RELATED [Salix viminalis]|uniref:TRANSPORTER putative-RELATED n=1 Tax=Salix viminalis TaxID=40686 RepID=A0A9Q0SIL0_SALVM|nr:TRANSPORTER putative-RELATED [Salix viminalis]
MSIMIVNDGKPVMLNSMASGLEGSSLHEILTYLLQKKEEAKLSSVAKEAGFQLLSDDFNIKVTDTLPSVAEAESKQVLSDESLNTLFQFNLIGILWTVAGKKGANFLKDALTAAEDKSHEVLLKNLPPKRNVEYGQTKSHTSKGLHHDTASQVAVGSILVATEKLNTQPFDKSRILIIKSDQNTGFQGLIYNKHMRWDTLQELEEESKLLKEAPLSFGGPLVTRGMPLVALTRRAVGRLY